MRSNSMTLRLILARMFCGLLLAVARIVDCGPAARAASEAVLGTWAAAMGAWAAGEGSAACAAADRNTR